MHRLIEICEKMKSDRVRNYVMAGLDSYLMNNGKVRLFTSSRDNQDAITPHSHRFDFVCMVLRGKVTNRIWTRIEPGTGDTRGDRFMMSALKYNDEIGCHDRHKERGVGNYIHEDSCYKEGDIYSMTSCDIHSIQFSKDAMVLFFEGPQIGNLSLILEPMVDDVHIKTYENRDYMFLKEEIGEKAPNQEDM